MTPFVPRKTCLFVRSEKQSVFRSTRHALRVDDCLESTLDRLVQNALVVLGEGPVECNICIVYKGTPVEKVSVGVGEGLM